MSAKPIRLLVTGATGLLGREVMRECAARPDWQVTGIYYRRRAPGCLPLDLTHTEEIPEFLDRCRPDVIVHAAAERHPDISERNPEGTRLLNVIATGVLARWAKRHGAFFIYLSTDYVFDGSCPPYAPEAVPHPLNAYGRSKRAGEEAVLATAAGSEAAILRVPILYGPTADWTESSVTVLAQNMKDASPGAMLRMDDWATRYPTFTPDVAIVLRQLIARHLRDSAVGGIFHWSGAEAFTKYDMARIMAPMVGFDPERLIPDPDPPAGGVPRPKNAHLDTSGLMALGIGRQTPFARACAMILCGSRGSCPK